MLFCLISDAIDEVDDEDNCDSLLLDKFKSSEDEELDPEHGAVIVGVVTVADPVVDTWLFLLLTLAEPVVEQFENVESSGE